MKSWGSVVAVLSLAAWAAPANAINWSVGANLGFDIFSPSSRYGEDNITEFAWPSSGVTPGLRFGFTREKPNHEVFLDTGLKYSSTKNAKTNRAFTATANYQYNFSKGGSAAPYLTAGGGLELVGEKDETDPDNVSDVSAISGVFGGGVGVRHKMGNGHGTLRAEVRFDRLTEGADQDQVIIREANIFSIKFGFDLWGN